MASTFLLTNIDLQYVNCAGQDFSCYVAFLNPISITTTWNDLNMDAAGNWQPPPNVDTCATHVQPYAPTVCMGSNRIGFVGEPLYFDGTRSSTRHDLPVLPGSHYWGVSGGGQITYYASTSQCAIVWPSPGLYTVYLRVADQNGITNASQRQVMIYQDRLSALAGVISVSGLSGSLANGGWQCQLTTVSNQVTLFPPESIPIGTYQPIVLMCETKFEIMPGYWQNHTLGPHGNFSPGYPYQDARILFDGYVQSGSIHQDVDKDTLSFSCSGPQMILQETKTHQLGYYNTTYKTTNRDGSPASCNTTPNGQGFLIGSLMTADVIHSLLQTHCQIGYYHDIHIWNANVPTGPYSGNNYTNNAYYNLVYTNLSINEGTIWSNIQDLCVNEWAQVYCEHDGSIRVGPQINYRGSEYWALPTLLGPASASTLVNYVQDLGFTTSDKLIYIPTSMPVLPASPIPVLFVHPWGHSAGIPQIAHPFQPQPSPDVLTALQGVNGPPIMCVFSDVPNYDAGTIPRGINFFPWTTYNWPQDLAVYPISFDVTENYTGRTSLVKLIGTSPVSSFNFSCWYPQNAFKILGDGTSTVIASVLPAGNWVVNESHLIADITYPQNRQLMSNWWWEMARRVYYASNLNYTTVVTLGIFTGVSLGDIVGITRQNNTLGPHWTNKPFYVQQIDYSIDLTARTWTTTITAVEVTSALLGPIQPPPAIVPRM